MKKIILSLTLSLHLFGYSDSDMDGVEDGYDKCANTPFSDLVDLSGCSKQSLSTKKMLNYDVVVGVGYSNINYSSNEKANTTTSSLQADLFYENWTFQTIASRYHSSSSSSEVDGFDDTQINLFYNFSPLDNLTLNCGLGVVLPTYKSGYDNEATDYSGNINAQYNLNDKKYIFGAYGFTQVNDKDVANIEYQNIHSYRVGVGQNFDDVSLNLSYTQTDSIYKEIVPLEAISMSLNYPLNNHWFTRVDYDYGLSESTSDSAGSLNLGYFF